MGITTTGMFRRLTAAAVLLLLAGACSRGGEKVAASEKGGALVGRFKITPGQCTDAGVTDGSYFRMVNVGGTPAAGPFVPNSDSPCGDQTWSPMVPGADGGLVTGAYQEQPAEPFDAGGNGTAAAITQPTKWFGVTFALATNKTDPQTGKQTRMPSISASEGKLSGDLRAVAAAWNGQHFNQGSPKPDGSKPGNTSEPTGTYDPGTKAFSLDWTSQIVGGPFNNFTGTWHLEGTFEPK